MLENGAARASADTIEARQWVKLIGKLRWAGLEDEAFQLEKRLGKLPTKARSTVFAEPFETD